MLKTTNIPHKTFVRCAFFMENWTMFPDSLKGPKPSFDSTVTPLDYAVPMIAIKDIGETLAREALTIPNEGKNPVPEIYELQGPEDYSPLDVKAAFAKALGREVEIRAVDKGDLDEYYGKIFPEDVAREWVEMVKCFLPGGVAIENLPREEESRVVRGRTTLEDAIRGAVGGIV